MKIRAEVPNFLEKLVVEFEHQSGEQVKEIMSDNGSEFVNQATRSMFLKERIVHDTSAPYTAQQNGRIEREMRTINTMARTMLVGKNLPEKLEIEALNMAVYLKNRLILTNKEATPFEIFTDRKPYLSYPEGFGAQPQVMDPRRDRRKLDPRIINGYVTGYTSRRNTYRVYVPCLDRIVATCDVYLGPHYENGNIRSTQKSREADEGSIELQHGKPNQHELDCERQSAGQMIAECISEAGRETEKGQLGGTMA